jgi:hypothetical protein
VRRLIRAWASIHSRVCQQFDLASITSKLADLDEETEVPKIKLGDASCAAPFTSKLSNVAAGAFP